MWVKSWVNSFFFTVDLRVKDDCKVRATETNYCIILEHIGRDVKIYIFNVLIMPF